MKKNILSAIVIFFVTFACLLALNEITTNSATDYDDQQYYAEE